MFKNKKGFTLVELLAVIVILGLLMIVAIPNITRVIRNARRDTYADNAKALIDAFRLQLNAQSTSCTTPGENSGVYIDAANIDLESGQNNKSSFNKTFSGQYVAAIADGDGKISYYYIGKDSANNGIEEWTEDTQINRDSVKVGNAGEITQATPPESAGITAEAFTQCTTD